MMNIKRISWWQFLICLVVVGLDSPVEGSALQRATPVLEWNTKVDKTEYGGKVHYFIFKLWNVAKRDDAEEHSVTLYQQLEGGEFQELHQPYTPVCATIGADCDALRWTMPSGEFKGDTKIMKAQIMYPGGVMVKSKTLDLENPTAESEYSDGTLEWEHSLKVHLNGD